MRSSAQELGELGERLAERWVVGRGWRVLARRFRVGHRDIDLVVRRGETVAFVEVKTRRSGGYGGPICAVGAGKRRHLWRAASVWIHRHGPPGVEYRFDVVGLIIGSGLVRVAHVENAFFLTDRR